METNSKHLPEKLTYEEDGYIMGRSVGGRTIEFSDFVVAEIRGWGHFQYLGIEQADAIQEETGKRLVAAYNSVAGIPTNALESGIIGEIKDFLLTMQAALYPFEIRYEVQDRLSALLARMEG